MKTSATTIILILSFMISCAPNNDIEEFPFLANCNHQKVKKIFSNPEQYEVQIRYTQINRSQNGKVTYDSFDYRIDSTNYFYPASTVKMPVAFLALEKINKLQSEGVDINMHTPLTIDAHRTPLTSVTTDSTYLDQKPTIAHYIHKLFVVSDNDAYNRLYEFIGPKAINEALYQKGIFTNSKIVHRVGVSGYSVEDNLHTNAFTFYKTDRVTYRQDGQYFEEPTFATTHNTLKGVAYIDSYDSLISQPFDFSQKNFISIPDLDRSIKALFFPDNERAYSLSDEDRNFLKRKMSLLPKESKVPLYPTDEYFDSFGKFFLYGDRKDAIPDHIRIFNKVGYAYGYLTDAAYIVDYKNKIDFFLTATIHVNKNKTYNDDVYEYDEIGIPFLAELGRQIYAYELEREREYTFGDDYLQLDRD